MKLGKEARQTLSKGLTEGFANWPSGDLLASIPGDRKGTLELANKGARMLLLGLQVSLDLELLGKQ